MDREREAEHRDRLRRGRGSAGHPGTGRAAADDDREGRERVGAQVRDGRKPRGVELTGRSGAASAGDQVGLLNERDADARVVCRAGGRNEVRGADATAGSVTEHERGARLVDWTEVCSRSPMGRLDFDHAPRNCHGPVTKSRPRRT